MSVSRIPFTAFVCIAALLTLFSLPHSGRCAQLGKEVESRLSEGESKFHFRGKEGAASNALTEDEGKFPSRGIKTHSPVPALVPLKLFTIMPPQLATEGGASLRQLLDKLSGLTVNAPSAAEADAVLLVLPSLQEEATVTVLGPGGKPVREHDFRLPADAELVERCLAGLARVVGLSRLAGDLPMPAIEWRMQIYRQAEAPASGGVRSGGRDWVPDRMLSITDKKSTVAAQGPVLVRFSFASAAPETYYLHIVNYTDKQVLPVLQPSELSPKEAQLPAGGSLRLSSLELELSAPVEKVRLIVSREPLSLERLAQDDLLSGSPNFPGSKDAPSTSAFASVEVVFTLSGKE